MVIGNGEMLFDALCQVSFRLRNHPFLRLIWEDCIFTCVFFVETFLWRGGWNLNTLFIIQDPLVGGWVNHCIGTLLLMSLQVFSHAGACGCALDTTSRSEHGVLFGTKYLRHFYRHRIEKSGVNKIVFF